MVLYNLPYTINLMCACLRDRMPVGTKLIQFDFAYVSCEISATPSCCHLIRLPLAAALYNSPMKLLDHYSQFRRAIHTCEACGWRGTGAGMDNGTYDSLGIAKHCPKCGERYGFARFSVLIGDDADDNWPPIG